MKPKETNICGPLAICAAPPVLVRDPRRGYRLLLGRLLLLGPNSKAAVHLNNEFSFLLRWSFFPFFFSGESSCDNTLPCWACMSLLSLFSSS